MSRSVPASSSRMSVSRLSHQPSNPARPRSSSSTQSTMSPRISAWSPIGVLLFLRVELVNGVAGLGAREVVRTPRLVEGIFVARDAASAEAGAHLLLGLEGGVLLLGGLDDMVHEQLALSQSPNLCDHRHDVRSQPVARLRVIE